MNVYDISLTISPEIPVWPGDQPVLLEQFESQEAGDASNSTRMRMSVHTGTHIDAPRHFISEGDTVEQISLKTLTGRAYVLHLPDVKLITAKVLQIAAIPPRTRRVLFRTRNSDCWARQDKTFQKDYVAISPDGARHLVSKGVKLVGIDYLSVAPFDENRETHEILLGAGVVIVEGLNLSEVSQGRYTLYCLPLKISDSDGAPARAILIGV